MRMVYDIAVIGAGVVGSLIARALSQYKLDIVLVEKTSDVAMGTTKANSGIVHAGFDAFSGTMKAKMNVPGCRMMEEVATTLHVPYEKNGALVVAFNDEEKETLQALYERGLTNGLTEEELEIIGRDEVLAMEPNLSDKAVGALYAKTSAIVSPYELAIGAVECAVGNGVEFVRNFCVERISKEDDVFTLKDTDGDEVQAKLVINAAGLFADVLAKAWDGEEFDVIPRVGEYGLMDRSLEGLVTKTIFQCPTIMGKGVLVAPTTHHNIFVGPTSIDLPHDEKENKAVRVGALREMFATAQKSVPSVSPRDQITSFAGLRAHASFDDFHIAPSKTDNKFINLIGIESPGLASSPAIAEYVRDLVIEALGVEPEKNPFYNPSRKPPVYFRNLPEEEKEKLIAENPAYARVICRCETITEGEIRDAIRAPAGAVDVDGVKRRTRAGMGRCQGGFCGSKVQQILAEELGLPVTEITKFGGDSKILYERTK